MVSAAGAESAKTGVRRRRWSLLDPRLAPVVFLAPFLIIFLVFRIWPLFQAVQIDGAFNRPVAPLGFPP